MKTVSTIFLLILTFSYAAETFASRVYECVDEDGRMTFAFAPCPAEAKKNQESMPTIHEQMVKLELIDRRISRVKRAFHDLPQEQQENLEAGDAPKTRKQIKASYQNYAIELLDLLSELRSERSRMMQGAIALVSQSDALY